MSLHSMYFSPTGGTKRVADRVAAAWGGADEAVDLTARDLDGAAHPLGAGDVCLIAVPSFGGHAPATALERLARLRGNGASAVLVAAYGNRAYEDTLIELADAATAAGFAVVAAVAAVAEHSIMRQFGAGRPDARDAGELRGFGERIAGALAAADAPAEPALPGNRPYRTYDGVPFTPKAGAACTACGFCAERCPTGAIPADAPAKTDKAACISCMRCVADCPQGARTLNKVLLFAAGKKMARACAEPKRNELFLFAPAR